ncbi:MAG TPA: hypothetical protein DCZ63_08515 [Geobacter sp.]|nr:hypothetical protein [Geobacter sp.]
MYFARYIYTSGWQLFKIVNGSATQLGSSVSQTLTVGSTYVLKLSLIGTAIVVSVDDVQVISVTDSAITDAGKIGFRAVVGSATTGYHLDSIIGADPSAVSVDGEMTLTLEPMVQELTGIVLVSGVSNQLFDNMLVEFYGNVLIAGIQDVAFAAMTQVATGGNIAPLDRTKLKTIFNPFSQKFDYIYVK